MTTDNISTEIIERGRKMLAQYDENPASVSKEDFIDCWIELYKAVPDDIAIAMEQIANEALKEACHG